VKCLYKLERGFTPASVETISFALDEHWIGVSTARGTTHIYQINPASNCLVPSTSKGSIAYELGVMNGLLDSKPMGMAVGVGVGVGPAGGLWRMMSPGETVGGGGNASGGPVSLYPVGRIKQHVPLDKPNAKDRRMSSGGDVGMEFDTGNYKTGVSNNGHDGGNSGKETRSLLSVAFMMDPWISHQQLRNSSMMHVRTSSSNGNLASLATSPSSLTGMAGGLLDRNGKYMRLHRQRVLSMHPSGILTLHYVNMGVNVEPQTANNINSNNVMGTSPSSSVSGSMMMMGGSSPSRYHLAGTSPSPRDHRISSSGNSFGGSGKPVGGGGLAASGALKVSVQDVLEWRVMRSESWKEVKAPVVVLAGGAVGSAM
jgi:hypothetical protein